MYAFFNTAAWPNPGISLYKRHLLGDAYHIHFSLRNENIVCIHSFCVGVYCVLSSWLKVNQLSDRMFLDLSGNLDKL